MRTAERGHVGSEQLLVLWTWLLEGYVPVVHIVAELDDQEAATSHETGEAPRGYAPRGRPLPARAAA